VPLHGAAVGDLRLMQAAVPAALTQIVLIAVAFDLGLHQPRFSIANVTAGGWGSYSESFSSLKVEILERLLVNSTPIVLELMERCVAAGVRG
jgi:hypothetical protein